MTLEVLRAEFDAHKQECTKDRGELFLIVKEIKTEMSAVVTFKFFYWVVGILVIIQTSILGYIVMQIREVANVSEKVQQDVSYLKGKLSPYEINYSSEEDSTPVKPKP